MNRTIGITGNICVGKSAVTDILLQIGAEILSYDLFLHNAYADPGCREEIVGHFGESILLNKKIDRTLLKIYLKERPEDSKKLWKITDRYIDPKIEKSLRENSGLLFFECAPLYEKSLDRFCDRVIACYTSDELRIERLIKRAKERDGFLLTREEAVAVIGQQTMSQEEKVKRADYVIYNDGSLDELRKSVMIIYDQIRSKK